MRIHWQHRPSARAWSGGTLSAPAVSGSARLMLGVALLLPLAVIAVVFAQLPLLGFAATTPDNSGGTEMLARRPVGSEVGPPPTLVPPPRTATEPVSADEPVAADDTTAAPGAQGDDATYQVQPGDQLKQIAASHGVSLAALIAANDIPDPDGLQVGQVLKIPR